jgi:predicted site-specific integrase-resolvase
MKTTSLWVPQRAAADELGVSERTLLRWRSAGLLKIGVHYRRKFPSANSPLLYQLERCEQAMTEAFARDHRTLELAGVA